MFSKAAAEHVQHLQTVLDMLRKHEPYLKPSTRVWEQTELAYLGHVVSEGGLKPDLKKAQAGQLASCSTVLLQAV